MAASSLGRIDWSLQRDDEGHREYSIDFRVETTSTSDGPLAVLNATGLPSVGSYWAFGNDVDFWAFCWPTATVRPEYTQERGHFWIVSKRFSTRPFRRCQDSAIEDPLLEPPRLSGGFVHRTRSVHRDRNDALIKTSSHELISLDKDEGGPTVTIEMNLAALNLSVLSEAVHKLNDASLWGMGKRHIKLNDASWSRNIYGICNYYFTVRYEFEVKFDGWDEDKIADAGTRCLRGEWSDASPPAWVQETGLDADDPEHFVLAKDSNGENYRDKILLNGSGGRLTDPDTPSFIPAVELYDEFNFLTLGIPTSLTA